MLWRLRDLLDKVFVVLSIVALIACPALLLVALVVIAVTKLAIDVALYASNTADPKTGRRISATDLAFDVFDAATAGRAAQLKEASVLAKGQEMYAGASTYAGRRSVALGRNGTAFGSTVYSKSAVGAQQKLLRSFGIDSTRIIYTQGKKKAVYSLAAHVSPTFVIGTTQEMVLKPAAVLGYGAVQGQEATKGPEVEQIEQSMDTDAPRPYFTQPNGARVIDILAEAHK